MKEEVVKQSMKDIIENAKKKIKEFENTKVKCAIIGRSGVGKSSLINAIVGEELAEVGEVETTLERQDFVCKGLIFSDLPGCSTQKFPKESYVKNMGLKNFDCVVIVTADRFLEDDFYLANSCSELNIPVYMVRTKIDEAVKRGKKRHVEEEETLKKIREDLLKNLKTTKTKGVYLTSADFPANYDLDRLINDISKNLTNLKRKRLIADVTITSEDIIKEKRKVAEDIIMQYAIYSCANGLNPIPIFDISVDVGILVKMADKIKNIYGLNEEDVKYYEGFFNFPDSSKGKLLLSKISSYLAKYGSKEGIILLVKRLATREITKNTAKYIPLVGLAISSSISFFMTKSIGKDMINDAEKIVEELLDNLKKKVVE